MDKIDLIKVRLADPFYDVPDLTDQQRACARMFAKGQSVTEIRRRLDISRAAVYNHLNAAAWRIGALAGQTYRAQDLPAVAWAMVEKEAAG